MSALWFSDVNNNNNKRKNQKVVKSNIKNTFNAIARWGEMKKALNSTLNHLESLKVTLQTQWVVERSSNENQRIKSKNN